MIKNLSQFENSNFGDYTSQNLMHIFFFEDSLITIVTKSIDSGDLLQIKQYSFFSNDFKHFEDVFITIIKSCQLENCPFENLKFYNISSKYLISKKMDFPQPDSFYRNELSIFFNFDNNDTYILSDNLYQDVIINTIEKKLIFNTVTHFYSQAKIEPFLSKILKYLLNKNQAPVIYIIFFNKTAHIILIKDQNLLYCNAFESNDYINLAYHCIAIANNLSINLDETQLVITGNYDFLGQFIQVLKEDLKTIILDDAFSMNPIENQAPFNLENSKEQFSAYSKFL